MTDKIFITRRYVSITKTKSVSKLTPSISDLKINSHLRVLNGLSLFLSRSTYMQHTHTLAPNPVAAYTTAIYENTITVRRHGNERLQNITYEPRELQTPFISEKINKISQKRSSHSPIRVPAEANLDFVYAWFLYSHVT